MQSIKEQRIVIFIIFLLILSPSISYCMTAEQLIEEANSENIVALREKVAKNPKIVETLISALKERPWRFGKDERPHQAVYALKRIGEPAAKPLIAALRDENMHNYIVYILSRIKGPKTVGILIEALRDENHYVRAGVARALGTAEYMSFLDLNDALQELHYRSKRDKMTDKAVSGAIESIDLFRVKEMNKPKKYTEAIKPLILSLVDGVQMVQENAVEALKEITGVDFGLNQNQWQQWWEQNKEQFR